MEKFVCSSFFDKSNEEVGDKSPFFCKTCDRSLSSSDAFARHLSSELHFKRSTSKASLEASASVSASTPRNRTKKLSNLEVIDQVMTEELAEMKKLPNLRVSASGELINCPTCLSRVNRGQMGKHLISHYHHHKSMGHPDNKTLALSFIEDIVMEAPFCCRICSFYCNWSQEFVDHWSGTHHRNHDQVQEDDGSVFVYWCSFCR